MIDYILAFCKFTGVLISGIFGVIGLLLNFKDKDGQVTKAGRRALILIITSTLVALISQSIEVYRERNKESEAARKYDQEIQRNGKLLYEVDRGLQPIKDVRLGFVIAVPLEHPKLQAYRARLDQQIAQILPRLSGKTRPLSETSGTYIAASSDDAGQILQIGPSFNPDPNKEVLPYEVLRSAGLNIQIYHTPIEPRENHLMGGEGKRADLEFYVTSSLDASELEGRHYIWYYTKDHHIAIRAYDLPAASKYWYGSGKVIGIPDLQGAQIFVTLSPGMHSWDEGTNQIIDEIGNHFKLETLLLDMTNGRELWLTGDLFKRYEGIEKQPIYVLTLPDKEEEFNSMWLH